MRPRRSFLGLSYDLDDITGVAQPDFIDLIRRLQSYDTGPMVLRIGASTADRLRSVWPDDILNALASLTQQTGAPPAPPPSRPRHTS